MSIERIQLSEIGVSQTIADVVEQVALRLKEKGRGAFVSSYEILGHLEEERKEFIETVHNADRQPKHEIDRARISELQDIAVAAIIGIASIEYGETER